MIRDNRYSGRRGCAIKKNKTFFFDNIGRRGSNAFHGALYEFLQHNDLNSNTWDNNRAGLAKAIVHDNRLGGRIGVRFRRTRHSSSPIRKRGGSRASRR